VPVAAEEVQSLEALVKMLHSPAKKRFCAGSGKSREHLPLSHKAQHSQECSAKELRRGISGNSFL
jgi:hypothetical protein